jgi:hypothetical protein
MCTFIYGTLPKGFAPELIEREFIHFWPVDPADASAVIHPGEQFGRLTRGHCDCDTPLARGARSEARREEHDERRLRKLKAKGWSEHKIEQWMKQVEAAGQAATTRRSQTQQPELAQWSEWLRFAVLQQRAKPLGLLVAWVGETALRAEELRLRDATPERLGALEQRVLYRVVV